MVANVSSPYLRIRWEKVENQRYYEAVVGRDLFGWVITRVWGRKGSSFGQIVHKPCCDFEEGRKQVMLINQQRQRRGYSLVRQEEVVQ